MEGGPPSTPILPYISVREREMVAKEQIKKSFRFVVLLTISMISIIFYNFLFVLEALYITINDYFTRTAIFLFCNLILLILAIDSGLLQQSSVSSITLRDEFLMRKEDNSKNIEAKVIKEKVILVESFVDEEEEGEDIAQEEEEAHNKEEDDEEKGGMQMIVVNDQIEHLEDEELKKRFEEFIERVKKARRLEAMQVVMAS